jgi:hypothetical protein
MAVVLIAATPACSPEAAPPPPVEPAASRCAVAWAAYLASPAGEAVDIELLVLDRGTAGLPPPSFDQARLEGTDMVGAAAVVMPDVEAARNDDRPYIVSLSLDNLAVGLHEYSRLAYVDERGVDRSLDIGAWRIEIVPRAEHVVEQTVHQLGGTELSTFSVELRNTASEPVDVTGMILSLPNVSLSSTMALGDAPDDLGDAPDGTGQLTSAEPATPVGDVGIPAGERRFITFSISTDGGTLPPFVAIQPMVEYRVSGEPDLRTLPLAYSRYMPEWEVDGYAAYCDARPPAARHGIG